MDLGLNGKRAIVTGGSRGIGRAICEALLKEGVDVRFCARTAAAIADTEAVLAGLGGQIRGTAIDVRDEAALRQWVDQCADEMGGIDIVVSNVSTRVDPQSADWWRETFAADLLQHVMVKAAATPHLLANKGGAIVFVGSIAATLTTLPPYEEAYGAMKAGLVNLAGQWAASLGPAGVRVNVVSPGPIDFPGGWWDGVRASNPASYERAGKLSALGRMGRPEEVARVAVFLASPAASYITGVNLRIDGALLKTANF